MSSVNVATTNADSNQPAAAAIEQSVGTKSSASPATFKSDVPAAAATSRSLSPTSVGSRPSKLSGGSSDADGEQEGGKGCGGAGAGTQSGQKTLRLTNAYMSDDGRIPEFAQPFEKTEDVCVSATSNILTDLSRHKCHTQVKQSDYFTTKTGEQMVSISDTEGRPDANYCLRRGNAHGEFEREDAPPPPPPPTKFKFRANQSLRRSIESGEYIEFLRRREHGGWNWFGRRKRRKKSPSHLKIGSRTRGCTNSQSSDRKVQVQPVKAEADYAEGIDAVTFNRRLKSLLVDNSEPNFENLIRLSCKLENYIALRRGKTKEELSMASKMVVDTDETPWDRPSSLPPNRAYSPDDAEQRTSVNSRSGLQSLTGNANAASPRSVREGGGSVRSPRLTLSISISSISSAERVSEGANKKERKGCFGRGKKKIEDESQRDWSRASKRSLILANTPNTKSMTSTNTGDSAGRKSTNNQKDRGCCGRGKKKNEDKTDQDLSSKGPSQMSTGSRR
ncbi:unnamed protein product, partial [Dibothriocephalus latus]